MATFNQGDLQKKMENALEALRKEFSGLRTGRASTSLLEPIQVDAYGSKMPITQLGNISVPEPRMLTVQVWDASMVAATEKAIRDSGLGLNPSTEGQVIRINLPDLSEERRKELVKVAGKYAEQTRIAVRNVRRDGMDILKAQEKDGDISEDDQRKLSGDVQKLTDDFVKKVDDLLAQKEEDILQV